MFSRRLGFALAALALLTVACASMPGDAVVNVTLDKPVLAGWFRVEADDPEWKASRVGFGLSTYLAEAWFDAGGPPLAEPTPAERAEINRVQGSSEPVPAVLSWVKAPLVYGRITWAGTVKTQGRIGILHSSQGNYEVEVEVTLTDPRQGWKSVAVGRGTAVRVANSAVLSADPAVLGLDDTAGSQASRAAIREAIQKLIEKVKYVQDQ